MRIYIFFFSTSFPLFIIIIAQATLNCYWHLLFQISLISHNYIITNFDANFAIGISLEYGSPPDSKVLTFYIIFQHYYFSVKIFCFITFSLLGFLLYKFTWWMDAFFYKIFFIIISCTRRSTLIRAKRKTLEQSQSFFVNFFSFCFIL